MTIKYNFRVIPTGSNQRMMELSNFYFKLFFMATSITKDYFEEGIDYSLRWAHLLENKKKKLF